MFLHPYDWGFWTKPVSLHRWKVLGAYELRDEGSCVFWGRLGLSRGGWALRNPLVEGREKSAWAITWFPPGAGGRCHGRRQVRSVAVGRGRACPLPRSTSLFGHLCPKSWDFCYASPNYLPLISVARFFVANAQCPSEAHYSYFKFRRTVMGKNPPLFLFKQFYLFFLSV